MAIIPAKRKLKIAKIIDEYSVVINHGASDGVSSGDVFEVYAPGTEIEDPDTGESLGTLDFVKAKIVARDVFPKMSVCYSQDMTSILTASLAATFIGKPVELNVAAEDISGGFCEADDKIHVGDLVRKIETAKSNGAENKAVKDLPYHSEG